jgi:hypothetical protein
MMIQEFYRLHGQMREGSMLNTHLVWVSLAGGQRQSPRSVHWAFPSGGDILCKLFVLVDKDAPPAERVSVASLRETLKMVLELGLEARVVGGYVGSVWNSDSDIEWSDDGV